MIKVITYGTFDLLHRGHIRLLERAKALGDYLIVGVTSDDYDKVRGKINNKQSLMERIEAVRNTGLADEIIIEEYDGQKIDDIKKYGIDIFTVGSDWTGKFDYLNEFCKVIYLPRTKDVSSSEIRSKNREVTVAMTGRQNIIDKFTHESNFVNGMTVTTRDKAEALFIVNDPKTHYETAEQAILDGKHVLCSSPISLSRKECADLFALAKSKNRVLMEDIKTAYSTAFSRLILLVKSGKIGKIVSVDSTCTDMRNLGRKMQNIDSWNAICGWGPIAMLPVFKLLGTEYKSKTITTHFIDPKRKLDGFTKIDFVYPDAVASIKVAIAAKSEGELIVTGTKGYIYVPAPWWKTDYFEIRYENTEENKRYFYQLNGEGIRSELIEFIKNICNETHSTNISQEISLAIAGVIEDFYASRDLIEI